MCKEEKRFDQSSHLAQAQHIMFSLYTTLIFFTLVIPAIAMPVTDLENQPDYSHYEHSIGGSKACPEGFMKDTLLEYDVL